MGRRRVHRIAGILAAMLLGSAAPAADAPSEGFDFEAELARVDAALADNPSHAAGPALDSCRARRDAAVRLWNSNHPVRAERALAYCRQVLRMPDIAPAQVPEDAEPPLEAIQARAAREVEQALALAPDAGNGLAVYRECAACHRAEGWGLTNGSVPQIAGQHRQVVIKQLADIRAGNRANVLMAPYSSVESIGGAQAVADVAAYIGTLEMTVENGKGPGDDLELGARLYAENCVGCHGADGGGNAEAFAPRIQAQHYAYLVRQFEWIRDGQRRNANPEMVKQVRDFSDREMRAVLDFVSRLEPPEDLRAPPGWHNPDFADPFDLR